MKNEQFLPQELLIEEIVMKSDDPAVVTICNLNQNYREICNDEQFWKRLYYKHFSQSGMDDYLDIFESYKKLFRMTYILDQVAYLSNRYEIDDLYHAGEINLQDLGLVKFPPGLFELDQLFDIDLSYNSITVIPDKIAIFTNLRSLDLSRNNIILLSDGLYSLSNLKFLDLAYNYIEIIDDKISQLTGLEYLNLSNNRIELLPKDLFKLTDLEFLNLSNNDLYGLDKSISKLSRLIVLDIHSNRSSFKNMFINSKKLEQIITDDNYGKLQTFDQYYKKYSNEKEWDEWDEREEREREWDERSLEDYDYLDEY